MSLDIKGLGRRSRRDKPDQLWLVYLRGELPGTNYGPLQIRGEIMVAEGLLLFRRLNDEGGLTAVVGYPLDVIDHYETATDEWTPWLNDWREQ